MQVSNSEAASAGKPKQTLNSENSQNVFPLPSHCSLCLYCGLICHHCLYLLLTQDFKWLSLFCWAINYSVPCVFLVSALSIGLLSYPFFWKRGWCFETEFAKGNTGTSAPTTTFLVGALVKYIYLFQHKEIWKRKRKKKLYLNTTWKPTSSTAATTTTWTCIWAKNNDSIPHRVCVLFPFRACMSVCGVSREPAVCK